MARMNWRTAWLDGLQAGLVIAVLGLVVHGTLLSARWGEAAGLLGTGLSQTTAARITFLLWSLLGVLIVWLYTAVRPRLGPGPVIACQVGVAVWILVYLQRFVSSLRAGLFPPWLLALSLLAGLVQLILASLLGAWQYKEENT